MRIAIFAKKTVFHKGYGGLETQTSVLAEGLFKKGNEVVVFSPSWELEPGEINKDGIKHIMVNCVYRMGPFFGFFGTSQKNNWINKSVEAFSSEHGEKKFDIALAQSSTGLGLIRRKQEFGVKIISISHGTIIGEYLTFLGNLSFPKDILLFIKNTGFTLKNFFRRQRDFVHGSDKVVAVSNYVKKALVEETFCDEKKIEVIHNGISQETFESGRSYERGKKVLYVGQIQKSKGMEDILKVFKEDKMKNISVDLVGSGDFLEELKNRVSKNDIYKNVKVLGKLPYEEVIKNYFNSHDYGVFIFPTRRYEGLPMVLIEAMFSGLPIVAYDKGGVSDAVIDGTNGFLVKEGDAATFSEKILTILNNAVLRSEFGKKSRDLAFQNFTLTHMVDKYEKIIEDVIK